MALDKRSNKRSSSNRAPKEKLYRRIATMWKSKHFDGHNLQIDDYFGDVLFRDKETGKFYKLKGASFFEPNEKAPADAVYNVVINLCSEYDVELLDDSDSESES